MNSDPTPAQVSYLRPHSYQSIVRVLKVLLFTVTMLLPKWGIRTLEITR